MIPCSHAFSRLRRQASLLLILCLCLMMTGCDVPEIDQEQNSNVVEPNSSVNQATSANPAASPDGVRSAGESNLPQPAMPVPPVSTATWVYRPMLYTEYGDAIGGMCFAVTLEKTQEKLLLTSLSVIGPKGGLKFSIPTSQLDNRIQSLALFDLGDKNLKHEFAAQPLITLPTDFSAPGMLAALDASCGNVAAFRLPPSFDGPTGRLSQALPAVGDPVWIVGQIAGDATDSVLHESKVTRLPAYRSRAPVRNPIPSEPGDSYDTMTIEMNELPPRFHGLLGAPVVDANGDVLAILYGTSRNRVGELVGDCVPVGRFENSLYSALQIEQLMPETVLDEYTFRLPSGYLQSAVNPQSGGIVWSTHDPHLGECEIELRFVPNNGRFDTSNQTLRTLFRNATASIADGLQHIRSNGELVALPGIKAIKGDYSIPLVQMLGPLSQQSSESGLLLIGVNDDHLVMLWFHAKSNTANTSARVLAERSFNSLAKVGATVQASELPKDKKTIAVEVDKLASDQRDTALEALLNAVRGQDFSNHFVDATGNDIILTVSTEKALDELAARIQLGSEPDIDEERQQIVVRPSIAMDSQASEAKKGPEAELMRALTTVETRNALLDPVAALEELVEIGPTESASPEFRARVSTAIADALFSEPRVSIFEERKALAAMVAWDEKVAMNRLAEFLVVAKSNDMMMIVAGFEALVPIADVSVVEKVTLALANDPTGHRSEGAMEILARFPKEAEKAVLAVFERNAFGDGLERMNAVVILGKIGGEDSLQLLKQLELTTKEDWMQKRIRRSIPQIQERLSKD